MSEESLNPSSESDATSGPTARRRFLKKSGAVAIAAPAAALLLSATSKSSFAQIAPYNQPGTDNSNVN